MVRYPQVELYLKNKHLLDLTTLLKDSLGNEKKEINIEGFKLALSHVDSQLKSLPATAQVWFISPITECLLMQSFCSQIYYGRQAFNASVYLGCCPTGCISS